MTHHDDRRQFPELPEFDPATTRRIAQDPAMRERLRRAIDEASVEIHAERIRRWCAADDGEFPGLADSRILAAQELAVLGRALGPLVALTPREITEAAGAFRQPRDPYDFS
jgi:hypothetical protein